MPPAYRPLMAPLLAPCPHFRGLCAPPAAPCDCGPAERAWVRPTPVAGLGLSPRADWEEWGWAEMAGMLRDALWLVVLGLLVAVYVLARRRYG